MNAFDLSLEVVIVGVRGAGKTLLTSGLQCEANRRAWVVRKMRELKGQNVYPRQKVNVWSNYPVKALWTPHFARKPILLESSSLNIDKLVVWDPMFRNGTIYFDEIDQVADRQDWYSVVSKFLTAGVQIIRHRNLSLVLTIQSLEWLNARLQWQADIIIKCRDLAFTPWGKEHSLGLGEVINTTWIDKSGIMTGQSFEESNHLYSRQFLGKRFHGVYSAEHEFDIAEHKKKVTIDRREKNIDLTGKPEKDKINKEALNSAIAEFISCRVMEVKSYELWDKAIQYGFTGDARQYGSYVRNLGVLQKGSGVSQRYVFEGIEVGA